MLIIRENTTPKLSFSLCNHVGTAIALADLLTLTLTFENPKTGDIINARTAQAVINANNVTVAANGDVTWQLTVDDTVALTTGSDEPRRAFFEWTWNDGGQTQRHHESIAMLQVNERLL